MQRLIHTIVAAVALACWPAGALSAQGLPDDKLPFSFFDEEAIRMAMEPKEASVESRKTETGSAYFIIDYRNLKVVAIPSSCAEDGSQCRGLSLTVTYVARDSVSEAQALKFVNEFNRKYAFSKARYNTNKSISLMRYLVSDYGHSLGNLRVEIDNLTTLAKRYSDAYTELAKDG